MSRRDPQRVADYLGHGYFTIDHTLVWRTIQHDLPSLREQVVRLLET